MNGQLLLLPPPSSAPRDSALLISLVAILEIYVLPLSRKSVPLYVWIQNVEHNLWLEGTCCAVRNRLPAQSRQTFFNTVGSDLVSSS